jgi:uncharacterized membrane protein YhhN
VTLAHAFALLTLLGSPALLVAERAGSLRGVLVIKPVTALGFVLVAWAQGALTHTPGQVLFVGMLLGFVGDVFLIFKHDKRMFLVGLVAFLLGHLAYVVAFALRGVDGRAVLTALVPLGLVAVGVGRWLWPHAGRLRGPVLAYIAVITAMVAAAIGAVAAGDTVMLLLGATLFYLSDLGVARERFVEKAFVNKLVGQPLYFAGQLLLAWYVAPPLSVG